MTSSTLIHDKSALVGLSQQNLSLCTDLMQCKIHWCHFLWPKEEIKHNRFHQHTVNELHYTVRGIKTFRFQDENVLNVADGQYLIVPAGCSHALNCDNPDTLALTIGFTVESNSLPLRQVLDACQRSKKRITENVVISSIVDTLITQTYTGNDILRSSAAYLVNAIIWEGLKDASLVYPCGEVFGKCVSTADPRSNAISAYISEHKFESIRADDVANHIGLQLRQANRICLQHFGCSITALIKSSRIESIKTLLETTDYSLAQIAEISGFSSEYSLIRHFHSFTGITPGDYRKNLGQCP